MIAYILLKISKLFVFIIYQMQGPRHFRPQGFSLPNRRPFNHIRGPHRTFGDRGRPLLDRGRFPRRGYLADRGGRGAFNRPLGPMSGFQGVQPGALDPAGGNLIVIRPKSAQQPVTAVDVRLGGPLPGKSFGTSLPGRQVPEEETKPKLALPQDKYHISQSASSCGVPQIEDSAAPPKPRGLYIYISMSFPKFCLLGWSRCQISIN